MCKMDKNIKMNMLNLLTRPDITVEKLDYSKYCNRTTTYYRVSDAVYEQLAFSVAPISSRMNNIARCEIILPNNKKNCTFGKNECRVPQTNGGRYYGCL